MFDRTAPTERYSYEIWDQPEGSQAQTRRTPSLLVVELVEDVLVVLEPQLPEVGAIDAALRGVIDAHLGIPLLFRCFLFEDVFLCVF